MGSTQRLTEYARMLQQSSGECSIECGLACGLREEREGTLASPSMMASAVLGQGATVNR